jgi:Anthrax toxin lethal factor, N- and C-terminal domain
LRVVDFYIHIDSLARLSYCPTLLLFLLTGSRANAELHAWKSGGQPTGADEPTMLTHNSLLITLCGITVLATGRGVVAQDTSAGTIHLVSATTVSERFQRETQAATKSIPKHVWTTLGDAGWRVQLAEFVVDAAPTLRGVRPRGWPRHLTWDNSDAIHLPHAKLLIVAERRRNRAGNIVDSSRVAGVLRHEIGHAFDMAAGRNDRRLSESPQFVLAYRNDAARIGSQHRKSLTYYLQDSRTGIQETFAEAFAVVLGGGSSEIAPEKFESHFPQVTAFARYVIVDAKESQHDVTRSRRISQSNVRRRFIRRR